MGVPWTDGRILRGCVIQCGCALDRLQDFEGLCGCALDRLQDFEGLCGCALDRLHDIVGLCYTVWVCHDRLQDFKMLCFSVWQVEGRDEEIERLTNMLDGGRPSDVVALEAKNRSNERMISHLNIQVCCIGYVM